MCIAQSWGGLKMKVRLEKGTLYFNDVGVDINPNYYEVTYRKRDGWADEYQMSLILVYRDYALDFAEIAKNIKSQVPDRMLAWDVGVEPKPEGLELSLTNRVDLEVNF
jgi:hypothetical protein